MSRFDFDLSLYLVTDRHLAAGRDIFWIVEEAVKGGCTIVQLREKQCSTREFVDIAKKMKTILSQYNVPLIINDRVDVALASDADGIHLGQSDMPVDVARTILGDDKIIGLSVENFSDIQVANSLDIDYIALSPVFGTPTKTDTKTPFKLDGVRKAMAESALPVVGIGGMNRLTAKDAVLCGLDGIAVVSDIVSSESPRESSESLLHIVKETNGSWCENAWNAITMLINRIKQHPFIQEMATGSLPLQKFIKYLQQDRIYLENYSVEFFKLADMLPEGKMKDLFTKFAHDGMEAEETMHNNLMEKYGCLDAPAMQGTIDYMRFTRQFIDSKDLTMSMAAMLPCMWVYNEVGKYIVSIEKNGQDNPYHEWISCYSSEMMDDGVKNTIALVNDLAEKVSPQRRAAMRNAFVTATEFEWRFWNQVY
ncbi:MAG: thiamine phosphate synthase [Candidatus Limimorpha sp.]